MKTIAIEPSSQSLPPGLSLGTWRELVEVAARKWSYPALPCSAARVVVGSLRDWRTVADDDVNLVVFREHLWCKNERCGREGQFSLRAMGMTQTYPEGAKGTRIRGADVELNSVNFSFEVNSTSGDYTTSQSSEAKPPVKLEAVVLHEFGHVLGLEDKCVSALGKYQGATCSSDDMNSVMFAPAQHLELDHSDVSALCALYPRETDSNAKESPSLASAGLEYKVAVVGLVVSAVLGGLVMRRRHHGSKPR